MLVVIPAPTFSKPPVMLLPGRIHRAAERHESAAERCFRMRDGMVLSARRYAPGATSTVLLLHGVASASSELDSLLPIQPWLHAKGRMNARERLHHCRVISEQDTRTQHRDY